jgi:hypothetical protein
MLQTDSGGVAARFSSTTTPCSYESHVAVMALRYSTQGTDPSVSAVRPSGSVRLQWMGERFVTPTFVPCQLTWETYYLLSFS